ncbi:hypothetical protein GCM10011588_70780 [Nocardia jinanensis]|uniref:Uncharacterized protein n=1 Tax=Nocardia jinanensis TaxID=382504 RepID=A0A917VYQ1_9NOCA|nr:hypothetical protein GCM10011588_70780 [Nocardia jinanensis]
MTDGPEVMNIKFGARSSATEIYVLFEPFASFFQLSGGGYVVLRAPQSVVGSMEICADRDTLAVWVDHRVEHVVLDSTGNEIETL